MSAIGYPDYQRITQWLGSPLSQDTGLVIGAGTHVDGPLEVANFAAIVVALKATGGNVTVTVKQTIQGGPASLILTQQVVVPAGGTLFEAFVLFGTAVEVDLTGSIAGTSVDYALYGSNTTTNAQVITAATINVQHNEVLVAAEPTLDLVDATGFVWAITDDPTNTRVKIAPPQPGWVRLADSRLAAPAASFDFSGISQAYSHLRAVLYARGDVVGVETSAQLRFNNDSGNNYSGQEGDFRGGVTEQGETLLATSLKVGRFAGSTAIASSFSPGVIDIPEYVGVTGHKGAIAQGVMRRAATAGDIPLSFFGGMWLSAAAINRITILPASGNFIAGSRCTLYGIN